MYLERTEIKGQAMLAPTFSVSVCESCVFIKIIALVINRTFDYLYLMKGQVHEDHKS